MVLTGLFSVCFFPPFFVLIRFCEKRKTKSRVDPRKENICVYNRDAEREGASE